MPAAVNSQMDKFQTFFNNIGNTRYTLFTEDESSLKSFVTQYYIDLYYTLQLCYFVNSIS